MDILPMLSFPSVVTDIILGKLTPYELFSFSLHSEEARNIVKRFCNTRKFHMDIDLAWELLTFNYENEKKNNLVLKAYPHDKPTDHNLKFDGLSENVFAEIETDEDGTTVEIYFKKKERGQRLKFLIEYMAKIFKNISISIDFGKTFFCIESEQSRKHSRYVKMIKNTIKKWNFKIDSYKNMNSVHTFKELEQLISCKELDVCNCELTKEELKKLLDKWMELEHPGTIHLGDFDNFKIEDLSSDNVVVTIEYDLGDTQHFDVIRADGIKARIKLWCDSFTFKII